MYCGNEFEAKRSDARFCGPGCQKAHKRAELRKSEATASPSVDELGQVSTKPPIISDTMSDLRSEVIISDIAKAEANRMIANAKNVSGDDVSQAEIDALPQLLKEDINELCDSDPVMYDDRDERFVRAVLYRRKFPDRVYHSNRFTGKDRSLAKPGDDDYPKQQGTSSCKYCGCKLEWDVLECCGPCAWQPETREQRRAEVMAG